MAIHLYCPKCYTSNGLDAKECSNCKTAFGRDRRYRVSVSVKGKRFTRVVDNLTIAREVERTAGSDMVREEFDITHHKVKLKIPTLSELWEKYLIWAKQNKKDWRTDMLYYQRHLEPRFGAKTLDSITSFDIEKMKGELKKGLSVRGRPYAQATIKHQIVILRRLFNLAAKWNIYQGSNPVKGVQMPRVDNQVTEFMTDEELSRLLEVLDNWPFDDSAAFVKFALLTGLRRGEFFKLRWEHVDFDRGLVTLVDPKGTKTQMIPVSNQALEVLQGLARTSDFVFPGRNGQQRTDFKGPWLKIRKAAGLPEGFRFHGLRRNFASGMISNGVDLAVVGKLLSHKQAQTTMRYAHLQPGVLRDAATKSGKLFSSAGKKSKKVVHLSDR
jgi:integrase